MRIPSNRNPVYNRLVNPVYNRLINPVYNRIINPVYNRTINPAFNRIINPVYNRAINPIYNKAINLRYNRFINPIYNRNINPKINKLKSPKYSYNFDGYYFFDLENTLTNYAILTEDIILIYDIHDELAFFGVGHDMDGYALFNKDTNELIGHLESNKSNGYNYFDQNNKWIEFLT